ncbi:MAG: ComEC/Rec2 family competence protein [Verrucomicrobiae bacterium]
MRFRPALFRQRLPFLGLLLAAMAGILGSDLSGTPSSAFLAGAAGGLIAWLFFRRAAFTYLAVGCAFACVQAWQTRESPAWRLAERVGGGRELCSASGTVVSDPVPFGKDRERVTLRMEMLELEGAWHPCAADVAVEVKSPAPARGDRIRVTGGIEEIPPPRNPAAFDARAWMRRNGITCEIEAEARSDVVVLQAAPWYSLPSVASRCCAWMERTLREGIGGDPVVCDLLAGMVLGVTSSIPDVLQQEFRNTGTFHLFSVSGLHVGMIGLILWQALKMAGVRRRWSVAIIIPALFFYALITGWKSASLRSVVMSSIFLIGMASSRQPMPFNSLCAAGLFVLAQQTCEIFNPGFQLSFLVVAAILLMAVPLHRAIRRHVHPDPFVPRQLWTPSQKLGAGSAEHLGGMASVSLAAWAGSLPLTVLYFHLVSMIALPANMAIIPLAFVNMVTACLALAGGIFSSTLAGIFNNANLVFTKALLAIVQAASALPGSSFYVGIPEPAPAAITVFDFEAGAAAAAECGGKIWLLDCGPARALGGVLVPWLHSRGRESPDGLVISHGDARHIGGAAGLAGIAVPPMVVDSVLADRSPSRRRLHRRLEDLGLPKSLCRAGDILQISQGVSLHVLFPPSGITKSEADDKVLVVRLDAGGSRILFLSDAGPSVQSWLIEQVGDQLPADILVSGHHRSGIPVSAEFLDAVHPSALVATAANYPAGESPEPGWVSLVEDRGIRLLRQDVTGAVRIEIFPGLILLSGYVDGSKLSLPVKRFARPAHAPDVSSP